jgi:hypothetical protein
VPALLHGDGCFQRFTLHAGLCLRQNLLCGRVPSFDCQPWPLALLAAMPQDYVYNYLVRCKALDMSSGDVGKQTWQFIHSAAALCVRGVVSRLFACKDASCPVLQAQSCVHVDVLLQLVVCSMQCYQHACRLQLTSRRAMLALLQHKHCTQCVCGARRLCRWLLTAVLCACVLLCRC